MDDGTCTRQKLREAKRQQSSYTIWDKSPERPTHDFDFSEDEKQRHRRRHHHRHHRSYRHRRSDPHEHHATSPSHFDRSKFQTETSGEQASSVTAPEPLSGVIGPLPPSLSEAHVDERMYGQRLLPGEGKAMANYVKEGKRIPRRGEIGLDAEKIEALERAGFVMSGSRHERMNAIRSRKEHQVATVEERAKELRQRAEDRARKEAEIIEQFREMVGASHQSPIA